MSILLYAAGAIVVAIGAAMIGFGVPINEFSFGNTLIIAGTVAMVGGMIMIALGLVVRELRHVADAYLRAPARPATPAMQATPAEMDSLPPLRAPQPAAAGRVPFPPKPKAPPRERPDQPVEQPPQDFDAPPFAIPESRIAPKASMMLRPAAVTATMLPPITAPAAPPPPFAAMPARTEEEFFGAPGLPNPDEAPALDDDLREFEPRVPPPPPAPAAEKAEPNYFDAMWPVDPKPPGRDLSEPKRAALADEPSDTARDLDELQSDDRDFTDRDVNDRDANDRDASDRDFDERGYDARDVAKDDAAASAEPDTTAFAETDNAPVAEEPRSVPILKSGVVDGMGYTLYVDGSIEAELPDGTLRFASINELRAHLEKSA